MLESGKQPKFDCSAQPNWSALVMGIQESDQASVRRLYNLLAQGMRFLASRKVGPVKAEYLVNSTFTDLIAGIKAGSLPDSGSVTAYARTLLSQNIAAATPEKARVPVARVERAQRIIKALEPLDRELITRLYLHQQPAAQICRQMGLTESQFNTRKAQLKQQMTSKPSGVKQSPKAAGAGGFSSLDDEKRYMTAS